MRSLEFSDALRCFRDLLTAAENGESTIITRRGQPIAVLNPAQGKPAQADPPPQAPKLKSRGWRDRP